jgi:membrane protein implicated in regulation of membrane protease activity
MNTMEKIYTIIFLVGVIYTVVTFLMGSLFSFAHLDGHIDGHADCDCDIGGHLDTHIDGAGASPTLTVSPLKPIVIVSFITVFGGIGMIGTRCGLNSIFTFILAAVSARIVSFTLYKFVVVPLYKAQNTSAVSQQALVGTRAVVISPILKDGFGVISYVVSGSKQNAPAKHINNEAVAQGEEVTILEIKNNVFYVQPLNEKGENLQV